MKLNDLKKILPFKWKPQTCNQYSCIAVGYIDARQVMDILDEVVGQDNWQSKFEDIHGGVYASIGIRTDPNENWVWKSDCGVESSIEKEKGQASDALKRAGVHWGIGRFLYDLPEMKLKTQQHTNKKWYPCDDGKNILWSKDELTAYCNARLNAIESGLTPAELGPIKSATGTIKEIIKDTEDEGDFL